MIRHRRAPKRWTAADWPFYRPGVNPVATHTPRELEELARVYLDLHAHLSDEPWVTRSQLVELLQGEHRNRYHRCGDQMFGLFDRGGREQLVFEPAFSTLYPRRP